MQSVGWQFFLSVLIRCYYRKYFSHRNSNNNNEKKRKTYLPVAGQKHTLTQTGSNLVEYLNVWFRWTTPINQKRSIRNVFFYLSSNSFASFLSQMSNLVHHSLHLSTWSPRFTSHDLYLRCRSLASRAKPFYFIFIFYFGPPKINGISVFSTICPL